MNKSHKQAATQIKGIITEVNAQLCSTAKAFEAPTTKF